MFLEDDVAGVSGALEDLVVDRGDDGLVEQLPPPSTCGLSHYAPLDSGRGLTSIAAYRTTPRCLCILVLVVVLVSVLVLVCEGLKDLVRTKFFSHVLLSSGNMMTASYTCACCCAC